MGVLSFQIIFVILFIGEFVVFSLYWYKRNHFLIAQRRPLLTMVESASLLIFADTMLYAYAWSIPTSIYNCTVQNVLTTIGVLGFSAAIGLRFFLLYYWHFISDTVLKLYGLRDNQASTSGEMSKFERFVLKNRKLFTTKFFVSVGLGVIFPGFVGCIIITMQSIQSGLFYTTCIQGGKAAVIYAIYIAMFLISTAYFMYTIRGKVDNFKFAHELRGYTITQGYNVAIAVVCSFPKFQEQLRASGAFAILTGITIPILTCFNLVRVTYWAFTNTESKYDGATTQNSSGHKNLSSSNGRDNEIAGADTGRTARSKTMSRKAAGKQFLKLINNEEGMVLLTNFLRAEFCVENILFYKECMKFKKLNASTWPQEAGNGSRERYGRYLESILNEFIDDNAPMCINISASCRENVINKISVIKKALSDMSYEPSAEDFLIFDEPEKEIFKLLLHDVFYRVTLTSEYQKWQIHHATANMEEL